MATIEVRRRAGGWADRARKYKLLVNGEEVGAVGAGESVTAEVAAGEHEVVLKLDWCRSRPQVIELAAGDVAAFGCWPNANPLTMLWFISFGAGNYIGLESVAVGEPAPPGAAMATDPATAGEPPPPPA